MRKSFKFVYLKTCLTFKDILMISKIISRFSSLIITAFLLIPTVALSPIWITGSKRTETDKRKKYEQKLQEKYRNIPEEKEKNQPEAMDHPGMAAYQDYLMTLDPTLGYVPRERLFQAYQQTRQMMAMKGTSSVQWSGTETEMGGRTRMIMFDPNDPTHHRVWAGGVTGGLWYNNDITNMVSPWTPIGDFWPNLNIRCMAFDPINPQIFYIGTGEAETALITYRESSGLGDGIWKSTDGGVTWNQLASTTSFAYVTKIVIRNEGGQSVIYAGVASGTYKGTQHQSLPSDGLFRSTNGGTTWTQVMPNIVGSNVPYTVSDIVLGSDDRIYVGSRPNLDDEGGATLLWSDDGINFDINEDYKTEIESDPDYPIPGRVVYAAAPSNANIVYALIASGKINTVNNFKSFYCFHILRSADKGITWTKKSLPSNLTSGINFATIAWHALDIAVDPNNPDHVYIGGLDVHQTMNGGSTWDRVSDWSLMYAGGGPDYIHADQHVILFKPGSSAEILFGTDGGVFYTSNGTNYQPVFYEHNQEFNTLQFYTCAIHPTAGTDNFLGGLQDNGTLYYTGTPLSLYDMISGGDGAYCFYDENDPTLFISSVYYNTYYIFKNGYFVNYLGDWSSGIFINPADFDYKLNYIYANAVDFIGTHLDMILRLSNLQAGSSGTFLSLNTGTDVFFSAMKYSPYSSSGKTTLFIGSQSGRLFRVTEAQSTSPQAVEIGASGFPTASISSIAIGRSEDTLLVTFSNYGVSSVWQTYSGGQNWQEKEGNLPDMPIRWALYHPDNAHHALLATETGIWGTSNLHESSVTWQPMVDDMGNVRVDMLQIRKSDNTVLAATHGRGFYTTVWDIISGIRPSRPASTFMAFPNPAGKQVSLQINGAPGKQIDVTLYDAYGRKNFEAHILPSSHEVTFPVDLSSLPPGHYFITVSLSGAIIGTQKIIHL
jgi:hypothetical protein